MADNPFSHLVPQGGSQNNPFQSFIPKENQPKSVGGFLTNFGTNVADVAGGLAHAVTNPRETVTNLAKTGVGAVQEFIPGDQEYETKYFEPFVRQVGGDLGFKRAAPGQGIAGSNVDWSAEKLGQNLYERPVDVGMSASLPLAPLSNAPGKLGKVGRLGEAALNPVVSLPVKGVTTAVKSAGGVSNIAKNVPGIGGAARKVTDTLNPRLGAIRDLPTTEQFGQRANALYTAAEQQGVTFAPRAWQSLYNRALTKMRGNGFDPKRHPDAARELALLESALPRAQSNPMSPMTGKPAQTMTAAGDMSFRKLESTRSEISRKARDLRKSGNDTDAMQMELLASSIDDFMDNASPSMVVGGASPQAAAQLFKEARDTYKKKIKSSLLDEAEFRAELKAGANYTQAGMETALRQEYRNLIADKNRRKIWTKDELKAIKEVGNRNPVAPQNVARAVGKLAPTGAIPVAGASVSGGGIGAALGFLAGGPVGAALGATAGAATTMGLGAAGKSLASKATRSRVDRARGTVLSGKPLPDATPGYAKAAVPAATVATRQQSIEHAQNVLSQPVLDHMRKAPRTRGLLNEWLKARTSGGGQNEAMALSKAIAEEVGQPELANRIFEELSAAKNQ